ncbi:MFS transporter [Saccharothrix variisporea]|uniref:MFS transporter n=1 Tax=Saccharothrix variisporea TaxID=543527 RepID=UPI001FE2CB1D|nr:MFS transporter [Saccharothrix variisporea]
MTIFGISLAYFMVLLDTTVLAVAEPDLAASLHASTAGLQWATTAYTVVFAAALLSAGAVADRFGAHRVFRAGVAVFALASLLSAVAPAIEVLVGLRAVLGAAAAACVPASMAMIARIRPEPAARARAVAVWAAVSGAAVAAGPVAGGLLVDLAGWRAVFLVNLPIAAFALVATKHIRCPSTDREVDWRAHLAVGLALAAATDALIAAGASDWLHAAVAATVAAVLGRKIKDLDPILLRANGVRPTLAVGAAVNFALNGCLFVLPLVFARHLHLDAATTGLAFLPLTLPFALNPPLTARLVARFGPRTPILLGLALLTTGGTTLGATVHLGSYGPIVFGLLCTGLGVSFVLPALVTALLDAAPPGSAGTAGGILNAVRQTGATLGVAVMGALGFGTALALCGAVCAVTGLWFLRRTAPTATPQQPGPATTP